jgi:hypothetical protein
MDSNRTLSIRRSHGYISAYSHLDKWEDIGTSKVIRRYVEDNAEELPHGDLPGISLEIEVTRYRDGDTPHTRADIRQALHDCFSGSRCRCEHDCCGCVTTSVSHCHPINRKGTRWMLVLDRCRNF